MKERYENAFLVPGVGFKACLFFLLEKILDKTVVGSEFMIEILELFLGTLLEVSVHSYL